MKENKWYRIRHKIIQNLAVPPMRLFLRIKEGFIPSKFEIPEGPVLIISNNVTTFDPFYIGLSLPRPAYYVITDDVVSRKFVGPLLQYAIHPIPKTKSISDYRCVRSIMSVLKEGRRVVMFPEGNRTYDSSLCHVDYSIAKLAKVLKVPLVIMNIIGGYGVDPRWSKDYRRGPVSCRLRHVMMPNEIESYGTKDLYDKIINFLTIPSISENKATYKSKNAAEYLERYLFRCPSCGAVQTLHTKKDEIFCSECGLTERYENNLSFTTIKGDINVKNVKEWAKLDTEWLCSLKITKEDRPIFKDENVHLLQVIKMVKKISIIKNGTITGYQDRIVFQDNVRTFVLYYEDIRNGCAVLKHNANFYVGDTIYLVKGDKRFNSFKYVELMHHFSNIQNNPKEKTEYLGI